MTQGSTKFDSAALDPEEREILRAYEEGRLRRASGSSRDVERLESAARKTLRKAKRIMALILWGTLLTSCTPAPPPLSLEEGETVVLVGGTDMVRLQRAGYLETILTDAFAEVRPAFRDLSWESDTVFRQGSALERWREDGFGDWDAQLERVGASVVIAQYGKAESMAGSDGLESFESAYKGLIDGLLKHADQVVLVSPTPFEKPASGFLPDVSLHNRSLSQYVRATRRIAAELGLHFVDLFSDARPGLTENGMHLKEESLRPVSEAIATSLGFEIPSWDRLATLHAAVSEKQRLWFDYWRPANWKLLYGDDSTRRFTRSSKRLPFLSRGVAAARRIDRRGGGTGLDRGERRPGPGASASRAGSALRASGRGHRGGTCFVHRAARHGGESLRVGGRRSDQPACHSLGHGRPRLRDRHDDVSARPPRGRSERQDHRAGGCRPRRRRGEVHRLCGRAEHADGDGTGRRRRLRWTRGRASVSEGHRRRRQSGYTARSAQRIRNGRYPPDGQLLRLESRRRAVHGAGRRHRVAGRDSLGRRRPVSVRFLPVAPAVVADAPAAVRLHGSRQSLGRRVR